MSGTDPEPGTDTDRIGALEIRLASLEEAVVGEGPKSLSNRLSTMSNRTYENIKKLAEQISGHRKEIDNLWSKQSAPSAERIVENIDRQLAPVVHFIRHLEHLTDQILEFVDSLETDAREAGITITRDQPKSVQDRIAREQKHLLFVSEHPKQYAPDYMDNIRETITYLEDKLTKAQAVVKLSPTDAAHAAIEAAALALTHHAAEFASGD